MKPKKITTLSGIKSALVIMLCILAGNANSQLYGEYSYGSLNYFLCSGSTGVNYPARPGMVLAGNRVNSTVTHFTIIRTNQGGQLPGTGSWEFKKEYQIKYSPNCGAPSVVATTCNGVSVIETNPTGASPNLKYVMAGSFDGGVFYAELNSAGNVLGTWFSILPNPSGLIGKPVICESRSMPGQFYIAGYQGNQLYAFRFIAGATAPVVARFYKAGFCRPNAIIESPFNNKDVTIVGETATQTTAWDGFFLQLNNINLIPTFYRNYDTNGNDQSFNSIDIANSNVAGGPGFVIGGFAPGSWMLKVDPTGLMGAGYWSMFITCSSTSSSSRVVGVVERINSSAQYQYYGVLQTPNNVVVARLNANGNATTLDEYPYTSFGTNPLAIGLSKINTSGFPDEGLQIYAAHRVTSPSNLYFAQACFSGQSGCNNVTSLSSVVPIAVTITNPVIGVNTNMTGCYNSLILTVTTPVVNVNACTGAPFNGPTIIGGSNARPAAATGLTQLTVDNGHLGVYPNPASSKISVSLKAAVGDDVKIELFDYLGRLVTSVPVSVTEEIQTTDINLNSLNVESGIYVISAKINGNTSTQKIIYNKE